MQSNLRRNDKAQTPHNTISPTTRPTTPTCRFISFSGFANTQLARIHRPKKERNRCSGKRCNNTQTNHKIITQVRTSRPALSHAYVVLLQDTACKINTTAARLEPNLERLMPQILESKPAWHAQHEPRPIPNQKPRLQRTCKRHEATALLDRHCSRWIHALIGGTVPLPFLSFAYFSAWG